MWTHYLQTLHRSTTRQWLYSALNVLTLALGIAVFLILWLDVGFETSFERWIPHANSIYVVRTKFVGEQSSLGAYTDTMGGTLDELRGDYPQTVGARVWYQSVSILQDGRRASETVETVDPSFFKVFDLPVVAGEKATLLSSPDDIVLSQRKAAQYFGTANPVGQRLNLILQGVTRSYRVSGILKNLPNNTDEVFDFLIPLTPQMAAAEPTWRQRWGLMMLDTYLRFDGNGPAQARALDADLDNFVDRHPNLTPAPAHRHVILRTQPLVSLHLLNPKDRAVVLVLGIVGAMTLLLAGMNYVNLATARSNLRAREVALRKVVGATRRALVVQFMGEALVTVLLAALIGLALCELALPLINAAGGLALHIDYFRSDSVLVPVLLAVAVIGLGAGAYPALVLARFQPAAVLASSQMPGGGRTGHSVREALVAFQFTIAIAFTIGAAVTASQMSFLRHADLGFKREGLVVARSFLDPTLTEAQRTTLIGAWRKIPGVQAVTAADIGPGFIHTDSEITRLPGVSGDGPSVNCVNTGADFFATYAPRLLAGRVLDQRHGEDDTPAFEGFSASDNHLPRPPEGPRQSRNVVANLNAVQTLGYRSPSSAIGKSFLVARDDGGFDPVTIVGVIDNLRFQNPHRPIPPTIYDLKTSGFLSEEAVVRFAGADPSGLIDSMKQQWRRIAPDTPFIAEPATDDLQSYYRADDRHDRLFIIGAALAVFIGCAGLYGLAQFSTERRVREIGIRKTLGASTVQILALLIRQFIRPVLIANLVAWPLAYIGIRNWLSTFDQHVDLTPAYFLGTTALVLLVAVAAVAGQALHVARSEPAKALRHE